MAAAVANGRPRRAGADLPGVDACATSCGTWAACTAGPPATSPSARTELWDVELDDVVGAWPDDAELAELAARRGAPRWPPRSRAAPPTSSAGPSCPRRRRSPCGPAARPTRRPSTGSTPSWRRAAPPQPRSRRAFAADGVDELLTCFVPRRSTTLRAERPTTLAVRCTRRRRGLDAAHRRGRRARPTPTDSRRRATAACTVTGRAGDLYLALWNRAGAERARDRGRPRRARACSSTASRCAGPESAPDDA